MKQLLAGLLAALLLAGAVPAAATLGSTATATDDPAPGATFAGVVGVQGAEVDNEVARRTLSQRLAQADTNASTAAVVANESDRLEARLTELKQRREAIENAYENGSITKAQRDARLAALAAQIRSVERLANRTAAVAAELPAEVLRQHGVNVSEIRQLAHRANELGGGAVAEAARNIAGEGVGNGLGGPPTHAGARNGSDRAGGKNASDGRGNQSDGNGAGNAPDGTGADAGQGTSTDGAANGTDRTPTATPQNDASTDGSAGSTGGSDSHAGDGTTDGTETASDTGTETESGSRS